MHTEANRKISRLQAAGRSLMGQVIEVRAGITERHSTIRDAKTAILRCIARTAEASRGGHAEPSILRLYFEASKAGTVSRGEVYWLGSTGRQAIQRRIVEAKPGD